MFLPYGSFSRETGPIRSRTTALPSSSPAAAGTQGLLAGTLRRPGGGASGGRIVAAGAPEQVAADPDSITGRYL